MKVDTLEELIK